MEVKIAKSAAPDLKQTIVFGEFRRGRSKPLFQKGEQVSLTLIKSYSDQVELGEYVNSNDNYYRFVFTPDKKWRYDAKVSKHNELHVFSVFLVANETVMEVIDSTGFEVIPVWKTEDKGSATDDKGFDSKSAAVASTKSKTKKRIKDDDSSEEAADSKKIKKQQGGESGGRLNMAQNYSILTPHDRQPSLPEFSSSTATPVAAAPAEAFLRFHSYPSAFSQAQQYPVVRSSSSVNPSSAPMLRYHSISPHNSSSVASSMRSMQQYSQVIPTASPFLESNQNPSIPIYALVQQHQSGGSATPIFHQQRYLPSNTFTAQLQPPQQLFRGPDGRYYQGT